MTGIVALMPEYLSTCLWRFSATGLNEAELQYNDLPLPPQTVDRLKTWADEYLRIAEDPSQDESRWTRYFADGRDLAKELKHILWPSYRVIFFQGDGTPPEEVDATLQLQPMSWRPS